jgi:hypothetical protein
MDETRAHNATETAPSAMTPYDVVPYESRPIRRTHVSHLHMIA